MHIGVSNGLIVASNLADERGCDGTIAPTLIRQTGHIDSIVADKGYDQIGVYEVVQVHLKPGGKIMIHPRANGVVSASGESALRQRNQHTSAKMVCCPGEELSTVHGDIRRSHLLWT